jgi:hypothetical protein
MALEKVKAGVQLFFWENSWKWNYKVMSKINLLINLMFFIDKTIQFWHPTIQNHWLSIMKVLQFGETIEISAQYFNKNYEFDEKHA